MLYILVLIIVAIIAVFITLIEQRRSVILPEPFVPGPETLARLSDAYPDDPYLPLVDDMQYRAQCVGLDGYFVYSVSVSDDPYLLSSSAESASVADALGRVWSLIKN